MSSITSRRMFVKALAALSPAGPISALRASSVPGEDYWRLVKAQFLFRDGIVPMNAANLCPSPRVVTDRVADLTRDIDSDCSHQNRAKFVKLAAEARAKVAAHLGADPDEVALVRNTSEGNNLINAGLPLHAGDEIVLWDQNHPTNNVAWDVRAARYGYTVKRISLPAKPSSVGQLVEIFTSELGPKTRVLSLTHVSNTSGIRLPVKEICDIARCRGVYTHIDGAQSWGALHLNVHDIGCDSFAASAHKWPMGPKEVGVLYVRRDRIGEIWPSIVAPGWGTTAQTTARGALKFETLGQRDEACLAGLASAMDFHQLIGPARIEARIIELAGALQRGLRSIPGFEVSTPIDPALSSGVVIAPLPAEAHKRIYQGLYEKYGVAISSGLRYCTHIYNTMQDVEIALRATRDLIRG